MEGWESLCVPLVAAIDRSIVEISNHRWTPNMNPMNTQKAGAIYYDWAFYLNYKDGTHGFLSGSSHIALGYDFIPIEYFAFSGAKETGDVLGKVQELAS